MKYKQNLNQIKFFILAGIAPVLLAVDSVGSHQSESTIPQTIEDNSRVATEKSNYDLFSQKLLDFSNSVQDINSYSASSGDDLTVHLGQSDLKLVSDQILKLKDYRNAIDKQCKETDESSQLLVNTLDHCLVKGVLYPALLKGSVEVNQLTVKLSQKSFNTCRSELNAYFREKEKRTDLTEKEAFSADRDAADSLTKLFESFGSKSIKEDSSLADSSELIKSLKNVKYENLCQVKLEKKEQSDPGELDSDHSHSVGPKKKDSGFLSNSFGQNNSEYEEYEEETIEEEETFIPLKPKTIVIEEKPVYKPEPRPAPKPRVETPKPTYQPVPYQPAPVPKKPQKFEPVPPKKNNVPFIPAARPAPRRAVVAGPPPVGAVAPFPIARSFGLSLGFSSFESNVQTPIIPPPMPPMPMPVPVPVMGGMGMGGGSLIGVSSGPRACLACGTTAVTPMPTLGLATMLARPCQPVVGQVRTQPVGACLPNMNQPVLGFGGINPNVIQVPRVVPGTTPIAPGTPVLNPTPNQPVVGSGGITPSRTSVPRVGATSSMKRNQRGVRGRTRRGR